MLYSTLLIRVCLMYKISHGNLGNLELKLDFKIYN